MTHRPKRCRTILACWMIAVCLTAVAHGQPSAPASDEGAETPAPAGEVEAGQLVEGVLLHTQTGEPVLGAPVQLDDEHFAVSSEAGVFRFRNVPPGLHKLTINDPECAPFETVFEVLPGEPTRLRFGLEPRGKQDMKEVVIKSKRLEEEVSDTVLKMDEIRKIPGTQGDMLKMVESLPGVARNSSGFSGAVGPGSGAASGAGVGIIVRGAAPEDSRVLIDGFEVPLLYHFGSLKSVFNADLLERIDFLPGAFGAEFGMATGGVIDVQTLPDMPRQIDGHLELSMLDSGLLVQGPIGEDAGFTVAARRSMLDAWLPSFMPEREGFDMTVAPVYYDYQAKVNWSPTESDRLSFLAFGSDDELKFLFEKPPAGDPTMRGDFGMRVYFHRLSVSWLHAPEAPWQLRMALTGGFNHEVKDGGEERYLRLDVPSVGYRADLEWQIADRWRFKAGVRADLVSYELEQRRPQPVKEGDVPSASASRELIEGVDDSTGTWGSVYSSVHYKPIDGMSLIGGVRAEAYQAGASSDWALMPRLTFRYEVTPGTILKAGIGIYQQAPTEDERSETFGNPDLDMERAVHYALGVKQELPFRLSVDLNAFYKTLDRLVVSDADTVYSNDGIGLVIGMELLIRRELSNGFFGWLSYTLMQSKRKDGAAEEWRLFDFDQTHILTLVAGYRLPTGPVRPFHGQRDGWEFGLRFQLISGNPYTAILGGVFDADYDTYQPIPGETNAERLPLYHRLDLRVDYTWAFEHWALSLYLDVQNVYSNQAVEGVNYNYNYTEQDNLLGLPIIPALGLKGSF